MTLKSKPFKPRAKTCKWVECRKRFMPERTMQSVCSPMCGILKARADKAKKDACENRKRVREEKRLAAIERKKNREAKEKLKGRGYFIEKAQAAFNAFIRERDHPLPCICCGSWPSYGQLGMFNMPGGEWDAGHFRSRGAAPHLRFDERNAHKQLKYCNHYKSGNISGYRIGLIQRIGLPAVEALEADDEPRHYSIDDLKRIAIEYRAKTRELKKQREARQ